MILTMALDSELTFWFIKQLFYCTLCLDSSLHRCIKVTNVSNKEKHDESYLIQFCLKDLLYACADTPLGKSGRKHRARGVADLCVTLSVLRQLLRLVTSVFFCWPLAVHRDWVWKALLTSNLSTWSHATAAWHSDEPDKRFHQFWAVNSHIFQIFINRYQHLPSPSTQFTFFYIYMPNPTQLSPWQIQAQRKYSWGRGCTKKYGNLQARRSPALLSFILKCSNSTWPQIKKLQIHTKDFKNCKSWTQTFPFLSNNQGL